MYNRAANVYRRVAVTSAPSTRILDELYRGLLEDCTLGAACIEARDFVGKGKHIGRALAILCELVAALDRKAAPELCANLDRLYGFVRERLLAASTKMETAPLAEAEGVIRTLREAFQQAARS